MVDIHKAELKESKIAAELFLTKLVKFQILEMLVEKHMNKKL